MKTIKSILVTGGLGFIGGNFVRYVLEQQPNTLVGNIDCVTYAANANLRRYFSSFDSYKEFNFSILSEQDVVWALNDLKPDMVINFAAESHVDNSIKDSKIFFETNVMGTLCLLESVRCYADKIGAPPMFLQVSTDEVYGDLPQTSSPSVEDDVYSPSSPYAASKASADHVVRSWSKTYKLPSIITHCTNNYGPFQHSEKFIPVIIDSLVQGKKIPIYGDGSQVRDWIFVNDHVKILWRLLTSGVANSTFNISAENEIPNLEVCQIIHKALADLGKVVEPFESVLDFVPDRPGHDRRYALANEKLSLYLGERQWTTFDQGIRETIRHRVDE